MADEELQRYCAAMWARLVGGLALHTGDRLVAEDLAQETLVRLWQHWDRVAQHESIDAWVWTVALNLSRSKHRRRGAERRANARLAARSLPVEDADAASVLAVRTAVAALPERQRMAVVLRYYADLPVKEVAAVMGCAENTVSAHTHKALKHLDAHLGHTYTDIEEVVAHD